MGKKVGGGVNGVYKCATLSREIPMLQILENGARGSPFVLAEFHPSQVQQQPSGLEAADRSTLSCFHVKILEDGLGGWEIRGEERG